jgi:hypothetical protein
MESDMATIYAYVKIYDDIAHTHDFMRGKLFMNIIRAFKEYRDEAGELRGDECEGITARHQPENIQIAINGHCTPSVDIAAPIPTHSNKVLRKNAFCIYSLNSHSHNSVTTETLGDLKATLQIHESCFGLGSHCVVVFNATEFKSRIEKAVKALDYSDSLYFADYFDEKTSIGNLPKDHFGYQKRSFFKHQREYMVLIDTELEEPKPIFLEVGDLSDICIITTPAEFNSSLQLKLPDGSCA